MQSTDKFTIETITVIRTWTDSLFSFRTTRDRGYRFVPGQFARIGVVDEASGEKIWRAYSIASASYDEHLEFFSVVVPNGAFTSRLSRLKEGDPILVERTSSGLRKSRQKFSVIVQSVRTQAELAYEDLIGGFEKSEYYAEFAHKLSYARIVTREEVPGAYSDRVTRLLANGVLETNLGVRLDRERSRIMLCGNPEMVEDSRKLLTGRGLRLSRRGEPGHLAVENYW